MARHFKNNACVGRENMPYACSEAEILPHPNMPVLISLVPDNLSLSRARIPGLGLDGLDYYSVAIDLPTIAWSG
ncbi:uncharacterized protein LAJ45_05419 [Morchella importuna]|uniref:uncharacterized protein n=1 Tax=Morchella importuna TaxID=1174673 RepID=UPI001E8C9F08|nr:uncharacterized protein LAJ45_05419 [Morchella importuna]KAH8150723.1 hypothetical protein LAJ45_05419 [Morchella importuna]